MTPKQSPAPEAPPVTVYYKPGCPYGIRLFAALRIRRIAYRPVRFRDDEEGAAAVRALNGGNEISPTVVVNGAWLTNPRASEVKAAAARRREAG